MQNNQPLDKGRVSVVVDKYKSNQVDQQTGQPIMKNRYANVGRATLWPSQQGSNMPNVEVELDTVPLGAQAPLRLYIFWDSEKKDNQAQQGYYQQQQQQQQPPQGGFETQGQPHGQWPHGG